MLERCLQDIVAAGAPLASSPALLSFLAPLGGQALGLGAGPRGDPKEGNRGPAAAQPPPGPGGMWPPEPEEAGGAPSGPAGQYGSLVRLLTEDPPNRPEPDQARLQRGLCAACHEPLVKAKKGGTWSRSSAKVSGPTTDFQGTICVCVWGGGCVCACTTQTHR